MRPGLTSGVSSEVALLPASSDMNVVFPLCCPPRQAHLLLGPLCADWTVLHGDDHMSGWLSGANSCSKSLWLQQVVSGFAVEEREDTQSQ